MNNLLRKLTNTSGGGKNLPWITRKIMMFVSGYDHQKYWHRRSVVVDAKNGVNPLIKAYYLLWIKCVDSKHHCSFGVMYHAGAQFVTPPTFHMGLMG